MFQIIIFNLVLISTVPTNIGLLIPSRRLLSSSYTASLTFRITKRAFHVLINRTFFTSGPTTISMSKLVSHCCNSKVTNL